MADFHLKLAEQRFEKLGIQVDFNENLYGELLDELAPAATDKDAPLVVVTPADIWGASIFQQLMIMAAYKGGAFPGSNYDSRDPAIAIRAAEDAEHTNSLLLYQTRVWSADVSGEYAKANQMVEDRRHARRTMFLGSVTAGVGIGLSVGSVGGAVVGGLMGTMPGTTLGIMDTQRNQHFKEWNQFVKNPEVIAKFGQVITYQSL